MKQIQKAMGLLLVLIMLLVPFTGSANNTESSKTYEAVVGVARKITLASLDGNFEDMSQEISNEYHTEILDDLALTFTHGKSGYTLYASFTPIAEGTASFDAEFNYYSDDEECTRVFHCTIIVSEPEVEELSGTYKIKLSPAFKPGVKLSKSKISLSSGQHASLDNQYVYYVDGAKKNGSFVPAGGENIRVEMHLYADEGYGFADADWVSVLVNSKSVDLDPAECSQECLVVHADFEVPDAPPTVTKDPTGETVDEGGSCSFVARASGNAEITWYITDGDDYTVLASRAYKNFDGLKATGCDSEKLKLSNIPASLDDYYVYAVFSNDAGETETKMARIQVTPEETPTPRPTKTPRPTPTPTPTPMPTNPPVIITTPAPASRVTAAPAGHTHQFSLTKSHDETSHFNVCTVSGCGVRSNVEPHRFTTTDSKGQITRTCTVCGYSVSASPSGDHVHHYSLTKSHDESYHFNACTVSGCNNKTNVEPHSFNTVENKGYITKTCTVCGYSVTEKTGSSVSPMIILLIVVVAVLIVIIILGIVYLKKEGRL